jgi:TonB family protein
MAHPLTHGILEYLGELVAHRRRLAASLVGVSLVSALALWLAGRRVAESELADPRRFGFEGARQWVERIRLEELAQRDAQGLYAITYLTAEARKGDRRDRDRSSHPNAEPVVATRAVDGEGDAERDLLARARMLAREGPVVRSEELVIERLVRPSYPDEARERDIQGVVELVALVDTLGHVRQVQVVGGSREPLLESAAAKAILECRYRPYRIDDRVHEVWAAFRIAFTLY